MAQTHGPLELYRLARGVGFSHDQAQLMAAIALAESGGNANAVGDQNLVSGTWGPSIGLWQIRSLHAQRGTGKERDGSRLTDPAFNARSARIVYESQGFRAWSVYSSGAWAKHAKAVSAAVGKSDGGAVPGVPDVFDLPGVDRPGDVVGVVGAGVATAGTGVLGGLDAIGAFFGALGQRGTWVRVLQVVGGSGLVVGGLAFLGKDVAGAAVKVAADVIPAGRAAKAAGSLAKAAS